MIRSYRSNDRPHAAALAKLVTPFRIEERSIDAEKGAFAGWASTAALDSWGTILAPGAFDESIAEHRRAGTMPALLAQHDWHKVAGRIHAIESRQNAAVDGLWIEAAFELETQLGREYNSLIQPRPRPALNGLSVGFEPDWDAIEWIDDVLVFRRVKLWEVSVVTFPANDEARIENATGCLSLESRAAIDLFVRHARAAGVEINTERDLELALRDAGRSRSDAKAIASRFKLIPDAPQRDAAAAEDDSLTLLRQAAAIFS